MNGSTFDYKFGNKNNWRRWLWNRIQARVNYRKDEAIVLYLAGESDLDRAIAISKGFNPTNLVSVERDSSTCIKIRKRGVLSVCADVKDVLPAWPAHTPIAAVVLDMCSGIENELIDMLRGTLTAPPFLNCVWAFNFMRGRDSSTNWLRSELSRNFGREKHRGMVLEEWLTSFLVFNIIEECHPEWITSTDADERKVDLLWFSKYSAVLRQHALPEFNSYKSNSGQMFDSLVWTSPFSKLLSDQKKDWAAAMYRSEGMDRKVRRKIAPVLAHRTMRMREL